MQAPKHVFVRIGIIFSFHNIKHVANGMGEVGWPFPLLKGPLSADCPIG